jgi:hypothetical protein
LRIKVSSLTRIKKLEDIQTVSYLTRT